ncbi:DUF1127 domain-containing protein [Paracoccus laeviglucosivorans]|uniref:DUF1127 domain-containing protein n=1 Tax=Paracoccus laeviglucosivorans TaxID=1197861 RepID=A0A521AP98_9RHOB|nr:DUF1127 domain-containing protein [Paracoccus laeviglucosivorans]SMO36460.1 protein of unknown function [Paracoccus laeviglucosivorans]
MALQTTEFSPALSVPTLFDKFFGAVRTVFSACVDAQSRRKQVEELQAKSDEQLAKMGLTRDRIVHHVFRDLI